MSQAAIHMLKRRWGLPDAAAPVLERFFISWAAGHTSLELSDELGKRGRDLGDGTVITDVGSTKREIMETAARALPEGVHFIGGHPLAGSEERGVQSSDPLLF